MPTSRTLAATAVLQFSLLSFASGSDDAWRLVAAGDFDAASNISWTEVSGNWEVKEGRLHGRDNALLFFDTPVSAAQKIRFRCGSDTPGDLSPILAGDGRGINSGYLLAFGGLGNVMNRAKRLGEPVSVDESALITPEREHVVTAGFDGHRVRLTVDGKVVHDFTDPSPLTGEGHDRLGLYINTAGWIDEVELFSMPPAAEPTGPPIPTPSTSGDNLLAGADGENPRALARWNGLIRQTRNAARTGDGALEMDRTGLAAAPGWIPIERDERGEPTAAYEISGWFRSANPAQPSRVLLDVRYFTADREPIGNLTIAPASPLFRTERDLPAGATEFSLPNPDGWQPPKERLHFALHAHADFSDLPNSDLLSIGEVEDYKQAIRVKLAAPLDRTVPAGTPVRFHRYLDYPRVYSQKDGVPDEWTRYAFRVTPDFDPRTPAAHSIWPGAAFARVVIIHQYIGYPEKLPEGEPEPILQIDDLRVRESGPAAADMD